MPDRITDFRHLPLSNGFMFGQVMRDERLSKLFLEELLQKPIAKVEHIDKEKDLADTLGAHGIRLDIYIEDEQHTRYNIEMQCVNERNLERRVRYYQGGIDRNSLERGGDYVDLPETYIIFICDFDYCGAGLPRRGQRCAPVTTSCKSSTSDAAIFCTTGRSRLYSARVAVTTVMVRMVMLLAFFFNGSLPEGRFLLAAKESSQRKLPLFRRSGPAT